MYPKYFKRDWVDWVSFTKTAKFYSLWKFDIYFTIRNIENSVHFSIFVKVLISFFLYLTENSIYFTCCCFFSFCVAVVSLKETQIFKTLNWIIQILHYYCSKQHKNIENSRIIEQNIAISLCSSLCLLRLALPSPSSTAGYFQFLDTVLNVTSDHSCCI